MLFVVPSDNFETRETIKEAINYKSPLFIRFGKKPMLTIHDEDDNFKIGKGVKLEC